MSTHHENELYRFHAIVGANIKAHREKRGLSQLELAHRIGHASVSVISHGEVCHNGKRFNLSHIYLIAKTLGIKPADLVDCGGRLFDSSEKKEKE